MREDTIRRFFLGEASVGSLAEEASRSVTQIDEIELEIAVEDMEQDFPVTRENLLALCDAGISNELCAEELNAIAFALLATDHFVWEDEIMSEVLYDWSAPEINFPLTSDTLKMHRSWLTGEAAPSLRPKISPSRRAGCLVSVRRKVQIHSVATDQAPNPQHLT